MTTLKCQKCGEIAETTTKWVCRCGAFEGEDFKSLGFRELGGEKKAKSAEYTSAELPNGRYVQVLLNPRTGMLTVDVAVRDENGDYFGNECVRMNLNEVDLSHKEGDE